MASETRRADVPFRAGTPLFIVGVGRSGTSLLQSMMASHSQIDSLPETGFLRRFVFSRKRAGIKIATDDMWTIDDRLSRLDAAIRRSVELAVATGAGRISAADLYEAIRTTASVGRYLIDKDPRLIEYLPQIFQRYPDAQIIHILRDPRDVLVSKQRADWSAHRPWWLNLLVGKLQLDGVDHRLGPVQRWRVLTVRYEDLIACPEVSLRRICHAIDIDFESQMLDFGNTARRLRSRDEQWKDNTTGPLLAGNRDKWHIHLTEFQQTVANRVMRRHLRRGGYAPTSGAPRRTRALAVIATAALRVVEVAISAYAARSRRT